VGPKNTTKPFIKFISTPLGGLDEWF